MTGGEYLALAYGVVFVVVLGYVAIIAAKLVRLQRETGELVRALRSSAEADRGRVYAARVPEAGVSEGEIESA